MKAILTAIFCLFLFSCSDSGDPAVSDSVAKSDSVKWYLHKAGNLVSQAMEEKKADSSNTLPDTVSRAGMLFMDARDCYVDAVRLMPENYKAWNFLGTTFYFTNQHEKSLYYFRKSIQLKKDYPEARMNLGIAFEKMGQNDSAIAAFASAIQVDSAFVPAYERMSLLLLKKDLKSDRALALLETAAKKKPTSPAPWAAISKIYLMMNDTQQAVAAMEKASEVDPGNTTRLYNLAGYYQTKNDTAKYHYYLRRLEEEKKKQTILK